MTAKIDYAAATAALTDDMIRALQRESCAAGDESLGELCGSALRGNANHRRACAVAIVDGHACDDDPTHPVVRAARGLA